MAFPPEAFLIGAQKAGTTYLARLLDEQPGVVLARPKEPHFFTQHWEHGLDWYADRFPASDDDRVFLDASPSYSMVPLHLDEAARCDRSRSRLAGVPDRILEVSPEARFIYVLRDPVERIWSAYWHDVRNDGQELPPAEAFRCNPVYLNGSDYLGQIREYRRCFPLDRFLFIRFEDLGRDPAGEVERCLDFLGVRERRPVGSGAGGRHKGYRPGAVARLLRRAGEAAPAVDRLQRYVWMRLPATVRDRIRDRLTRPIPAMDPDLRAQLEARYRPMIEPLEGLTGLDLSAWCNARDPGGGIPEAGRRDRERVSGGAP